MISYEGSQKTYKKELIVVSILTILLAFMDISGLPCSLFLNIEVWDIDPIYWALMLNFIEKLFIIRNNKTVIAVISSSVFLEQDIFSEF